jgi:NAD(P) transhydrogenase subunit alpha
MVDITILTEKADELAKQSAELSQQTKALQEQLLTQGAVDPFVFGITVFVLACFVGYYVVWRVTPALHTPLMSVTNAISGIIIVGAIVALGPEGFGLSHVLGFLAVVLASVNIFGGFMVTQRMLEMFKKKEKPKH